MHMMNVGTKCDVKKNNLHVAATKVDIICYQTHTRTHILKPITRKSDSHIHKILSTQTHEASAKKERTNKQ